MTKESAWEPQQGDPSSQILDEEAFRRLLTLEADRAIRYQDFFALCLVRPDQMSPADRGSETLAQTVARKIAEFVRSSDVVGRLGEGIGVLLLHAASADALAVAERLRSQIGNVRFQAEPAGSVRKITLSVGEVSFPHDGHNESLLLSRARQRLEKAVRSGGNRVVEADNG
jgi:diguanylate cyclase (GGDEF)-like protein